MKIFVDENIPLGQEAFQDHGTVTRFAGRKLVAADLIGAEALIVRSITKVNAALLSGTSIKFVATATIGTDHVDQAYLQNQGIGFASAPGCNSNSVGEYVAAALTHLEVKKGFNLTGKVLGIIGYGHVGKNLALKAEALGLKVIKCDPPLQAMSEPGSGEFSDLETLLKAADIISLHVPLNKEGLYPTLKLVNDDFFSRLSRPIVLINTCRGEVIDEPALQKALQAGQIRHLVLDVFANEPNINQTLGQKADLITPHIAGYSWQGKMNGTEQAANAFRTFFHFPDRWKAQYPGPLQPILNYPDLNQPLLPSDSEFRQQCLASAYNILEDDARLRQSFQEVEPGRIFDQLRREYPIRYEFPFFKIRGLPQEKRDLRSQLIKLGFQVL